MNILDTLDDDMPDRTERIRRKLLMNRAMKGCDKSKATLKGEYGLTMLYRNGRKLRL